MICVVGTPDMAGAGKTFVEGGAGRLVLCHSAGLGFGEAFHHAHKPSGSLHLD